MYSFFLFLQIFLEIFSLAVLLLISLKAQTSEYMQVSKTNSILIGSLLMPLVYTNGMQTDNNTVSKSMFQEILSQQEQVFTPAFQNQTNEFLADTINFDTISKKTDAEKVQVQQDSFLLFNYESVKKYIFSNIFYPTEAINKGVEGKVLVHFCIQKNGKINDIYITKSIHPLLDSAALQLIRAMPQWKPLLRQGVPESISYTIPVLFELKK